MKLLIWVSEQVDTASELIMLKVKSLFRYLMFCCIICGSVLFSSSAHKNLLDICFEGRIAIE
jgi:hypothetical protein